MGSLCKYKKTNMKKWQMSKEKKIDSSLNSSFSSEFRFHRFVLVWCINTFFDGHHQSSEAGASV